MSYNNLHNNHPLINRNNKCLLNRKIVTIHSEDRDINKYPNPNNFSITLPEPIKNIQSMRLLESIFPADLYIFSNFYQNTKMKIGINSNPNYSGPNNPIDINGTIQYFETLETIEISEGNYTYSQLSLELQNALNNIDSVSGFVVTYSVPEQKFYIANTSNFYFAFIFNQSNTYNNCSYNNVFNNNVRWGLGWNLGFKKQVYLPNEHTDTTKDGMINSQSSPWFSAPSDPSKPVYWIKSEMCSNIRSSEVIYMDVEKYNSVDELVPNVSNTTSNYISNANCVDNNCNTICVNGELKKSNSTAQAKSNYEKVLNSSSSTRTASLKNVNSCLNKSNQNDYGGKVNSVFAKIYTRGFNVDVINESITDGEQGAHNYITTFNNQLEEKISKLHFKFRFHDGTPVDFCNKDFNFAIEFNSIKSDLNDFELREVYNSYS
jgi:hypothetical protein